MAGIRPFDKQLNCAVPERPVSTWICNWFGPDHFVTQRSIVEQQLEGMQGQQLAIVRYSPDHDPIDEWVFNGADLDGSKVIWARAMDSESDQQLMRYYGGRQAWLIQPDDANAEVTPYPLARQVTGGSFP
jgi:hypothetical protein